MPEKSLSIRIGTLHKSELAEAKRIVCLAFGVFLGMPNPLEFMGDCDFITPRWRARNTKVLAARDGKKLVGVNVATRWGSFAFFGPLTVLPDYWNRGVAQQLLSATMKVFERWGVSRTGLYTFSHSAKHVALYQKFGYWPGNLTALMRLVPQSNIAPITKNAKPAVLLTTIGRDDWEKAILACAELAGGLLRGLDLTGEIWAVLKQRIGEVILVNGRGALDGFAICMHGPGSEGGANSVYLKFAAARGGASAGDRFTRLLDAAETFAFERGANLEAGVSLACVDAFRRMHSRGYRAFTQGVAMHRPDGEGFHRRGAYVISDWR